MEPEKFNALITLLYSIFAFTFNDSLRKCEWGALTLLGWLGILGLGIFSTIFFIGSFIPNFGNWPLQARTAEQRSSILKISTLIVAGLAIAIALTWEAPIGEVQTSANGEEVKTQRNCDPMMSRIGLVISSCIVIVYWILGSQKILGMIQTTQLGISGAVEGAKVATASAPTNAAFSFRKSSRAAGGYR